MVAKTTAKYIPERGDVVWLEFDPQAGHEQAGRRPALIISPKTYNQITGLALVCPITSKVKKYPFEVALPSALKISGVILADHIKSLDWHSRQATFIVKVQQEIIAEVIAKIDAILN